MSKGNKFVHIKHESFLSSPVGKSYFKGSNSAKNRLSKLRKRAHKLFDKIWKDGYTSRGDAYKLLSVQLKIPPDKARISMLDSQQCEELIEILKKLIQ